MKNLYKNKMPTERTIASIQHELLRSKGLIPNDLIKACLTAIDKNTKVK